MTKDTRSEALDKIQEIADVLALYDVPADVQEGLRIIEAIARHRDISNVNPDHDKWLARIKRANQLPDED
ncbi:MAG TPA: hypothetical protein VE863_22640 [Pyrinomonadaceae bacterium]|nr:hypothetical protein [Pyrinomonadaceae bacterium]